MKRILIVAGIVAAVVVAWNLTDRTAVTPVDAGVTDAADTTDAAVTDTVTDTADLAVATLAGGCFWCVEATLEKVAGIAEVVSGYTGGRTTDPTYYQVGGGGTGHTEAVQVFYDPAVISYRGVLHYFWREIDPTDGGGQFVDRGSMYRPAIYYHNDEEKTAAFETRDALESSGRFDAPFAIEIEPAQKFYDAEDYHQDYYKKKPNHYNFYRFGSGRDQFLQKTWGDALHAPYPGDDAHAAGDINAGAHQQYRKPADAVIKSKLTDMQYAVTQHDGTEPPYQNAFWDNKRNGIYVDVVSGEPLFSSTDKYKSNTGWPSFTRPLDENFLVEKADYKLIFPRVEVRSKYGDSHLGHLFNDGPAPTGLRYCINSAALRFVAADNLVDEGYGEYKSLFE